MKWLTLQDLELIHIQIVDASGGSQGTRDSGRLESALAAMQQNSFGQELYPSIFDKAAVLCRGLIADHPFVDGNKRTGMMSAIIFLNLNDIDTTSIQDKELEDFAVQIAVENCNVEEIAKWFEANSRKTT
ncbi:MAG: death-on-curing protein [Candidatus Saccharimonadales bacterium]|jgi:death-on-curing protein